MSHLHVLGSEDDPLYWGMADFRDVIYFPTRAILEGVNPYDSAPTDDPTRYCGRYPVGNVFPVYSPLLFLLDAPLQLLPYKLAMAAYSLFNVCLLLVLAALILRIVGVSGGFYTTLILASIMLLSRPGQSNFYFGQLAIPMVLCAVSAWHCSASQSGWAAAALALSTIKPTFGGPLLVLTFCQRRWRSSFGGAMLGGTIAVIGFVLVFANCHSGASALTTIQQNLIDTQSGPGFDPQTTGIRLDIGPVVERLSPLQCKSTLEIVVPIGLLAISGAVLWALSFEKLHQASWIAIPLSAVTVLLCVFHGAYDGLLLTLPILTLLFRKRNSGSDFYVNLVGWCIVGLLMVPAVNVLSSNQFQKIAAQYVRPYVANTDEGWLWSLASVLNSLALFAAWALLIGSAVCAVISSHSGKPTLTQQAD